MDIETTGLLPWYGDRITCICAKDDNSKIFQKVDKDEKKLLNMFFMWMYTDEKIFLVTKNGKGFDIPFIMARYCLNYGLDPEDNELNLLKYPHLDLQEITSRRIQLQSMAELLNCAPKSGTGINAIKLWNEGRYKELKEYCLQDVETTEEVFLKWRKIQEGKLCWQCEGSGKVRDNHSNPGGSYTFGSAKCDTCNGKGKISIFEE